MNTNTDRFTLEQLRQEYEYAEEKEYAKRVRKARKQLRKALRDG